VARWEQRPLEIVEAIVFSRDRAQQLDAFLQSCERHAAPLLESMAIVFRASDRSFHAGYGRLRELWPAPEWISERDFRLDVTAHVGRREYTVFHTDDDLYFREVDTFLVGDDIACFAFRLGVNTTYCYPLDLTETVEPALNESEWIAWRWREHGRGAFGYPLALNGHVFDSRAVIRWLEASDFSNPNELEVALQRFLPELAPLMASFRHSRLVNVPANLVNESFANRHAGVHTTRSLNERFLCGERIDPAAMDFSTVTAAHQELEYVFRPTHHVRA
jgi:hypothetical protein